MKPVFSKKLVVLLALVFLTRLVFSLISLKINGPDVFISPDTSSYAVPAASLLHGAFLSDGAFCIKGGPEIMRTPGYPVFLIPAIAWGHIIILGFLENLLLTVASAWLIWIIVTELASDRAAFWAVLLFCFEPMGILQAEKILPETLFTTLLLLFVWLFLNFLRSFDYRKLGLSIAVLSCAAYVRPVPLYLGLWLIPVLLLFPRAFSWKQRVVHAVLFPSLFALTLLPWVLRNTRAAGYNGFTTSAVWNYFLSAGEVKAKLEHRGLYEVLGEGDYVEAENFLRSHPDKRGWSQGEIAQLWTNEAKKTIRSHPFLYAGLHARSCAAVMFNPGVSELLGDLGLYPRAESRISSMLTQGYFQATLWLVREYPITAIAIPLMLGLTLLYYLFALIALRHVPLSAAFFLVAVCTYFILASGIPAAQARYRAPIMPLVCVGAGIGIASRTKSRLAAAASQSK